MLRRFWRWVPAGVLIYVLYFSGLGGVGMLGPDEPRYAAIAREMARSGDWVTPRLWGSAWLEKPPLTYWLGAVGFRLGLNQELAPRVPVAMLSVAFLLLYYRMLRREFGDRAAFFATVVLGTSAGWVAFSRVAVTDLPMAVTFSAAMLCVMRWLGTGERQWVVWSAFWLGWSVLAKGLAPLVLAAPAAVAAGRRVREWLDWRAAGAFLGVAVPWYAAMIWRCGGRFIEEFFWKHHVMRALSDQLQHVQPVWFYLPVLAAGLFPWVLLAGAGWRREWLGDGRIRLLLGWLLFGLAFLSLVRNKLPGYLLPLLPAAAALMGIGMAQARSLAWRLGATGALLGFIPVAGAVLPSALVVGIRRAEWGGWDWRAAGLSVAAGVLAGLWAERRRVLAVAAVAAAVGVGVLYLQIRVLPVLDQRVSVRGFWRREGAALQAGACVEGVDRERRYGLAYYVGQLLPDCSERALKVRVSQGPAGGLEVKRREGEP